MLEKELTERMDGIEAGSNKVFKVVFEKLDNLEEKLPSHGKDRQRIGLKD